MKLIIQIPCFNEEETLPGVIADLPKKIEAIDQIEYLIINDSSTDRTAEVARELGVHHIVNFKRNKGLAKVFAVGLDACLYLGADIIVNTDGDNQYNGADVEKLIQPILDGKADIVIGERPIDSIEHFSKGKKILQHLGSWVVSYASDTNLPDTTSGFRALSREAALRTNVINEFTYTLETIIQAGHQKTAIVTVPIRTNPKTRESRLFKGIGNYLKRSLPVIIRSFMMYKPLKFFMVIGFLLLIPSFLIGIRFLYYYFRGSGGGHIQSLILAAILSFASFQTIILGLIADIIAANRKLIEDVQYRIRSFESSFGNSGDKNHPIENSAHNINETSQE